MSSGFKERCEKGLSKLTRQRHEPQRVKHLQTSHKFSLKLLMEKLDTLSTTEAATGGVLSKKVVLRNLAKFTGKHHFYNEKHLFFNEKQKEPQVVKYL